MKDLLVLLTHLLTTIAKLLGPGGARAIVADSLLMNLQLLIINRSWQRAPNLSALDRFLPGFWSLFLNTTTRIEFINHWPETHRRLLAVIPKLNAQNLVTIPGYHTATDFFRRQLLHE